MGSTERTDILTFSYSVAADQLTVVWHATVSSSGAPVLEYRSVYTYAIAGDQLTIRYPSNSSVIYTRL